MRVSEQWKLYKNPFIHNCGFVNVKLGKNNKFKTHKYTCSYICE